MEQFGWTEKQLVTELTGEQIKKISEYNKIKNFIQKEEERKSHGGS